MNTPKSKFYARLICVILAALMLVAAGCTPNEPVVTAETDGDTTGAPETDEETEPVETEEPIVYVQVSDKLEMPKVNSVISVDYITANLNLILKNGYGASSLQADAFAKIKDRLIIFKASRFIGYAYVLGEARNLATYLAQLEDGNFLSVRDFCGIFGGSYTSEKVEGVLQTKLVIGDKTLFCTAKQGFISTTGQSLTEGATEVAVNTYIRTINNVDENLHFINVKTAAELTGLTVYETDSGLIAFSCGQAFDKTRGYYIVEEAEKLFLAAEEIAGFSSNMFVDIPNVFKYSDYNTTVMSFPAIDLHANVTAYALQGVTSPVSLAPAIVAGQGEDDSNFTVVRVFDTYQTEHTQFNAYPASVKGGVQVACAAIADSFNILTAPFKSKNVRALRVFDSNGSFLFTVSPSGEAPYAIAGGDFLGGSDCFAVCSMYGQGNKTIEYFSAADGTKLGETTTALASSAQTLISANHETTGKEGLLICFLEEKTKAYEIKDNNAVKIEIGEGAYNGVFASAFGGYIGTNDATDEYLAFSTVSEYKDGVTTVVDAGRRENMFFTTWAEAKKDAYITRGNFWHSRMEFQSPVMTKISKGKTTAIRTNDIALFNNSLISGEANLYNSQYNMWEPCATHRWNKTAQMGYLIDYIDPDTETYAYAALNRKGERYDYAELASSFYNATYAPFIPALDRLHYWTLRTYLNKLATLYRRSPETTVAMSPVHEHEIDTGSNSVGDYNPKMIAGFADYMEDLYGTVENVNKTFGTEFASFDELDVPRDTSRGTWDKYSTKRKINAYFTQWALYNRYIVSQRIIESYREALLAGFPPEMITAHQIPEGDAVAGLLGEADTRLSPVDIVLACGTGYGGTRYGYWSNSKQSFFALANTAGHNNITIGEYSTMTAAKGEAYKQLKYIFDNGGLFLHTMTWNGNIAGGDQMDASERYAIEKLQSEDMPRSTSSGGVGDAHEYTNGSTTYNIVEIGSKETSTGLLKSINADGSHEGSVYLQPFHAAVAVIDLVADATASGTGKLSYDITGRVNAREEAIVGINYNDTVDVRAYCKPTGKYGKLTFRVYQNGNEMTDLSVTYTVRDAREYRFVFKNQLYLENCTITVEYENIEASDIDVTFMYEMNARKYYKELYPKAHTGGVSFDLLY